MNIYGIILTTIFSGMLLFFAVRFVLEIRLNQKLKIYQKVNHQIVHHTWKFALKRSFMVFITTGLLGITVLSNTFQTPYTIDDRTLVNAQPVLTSRKLRSLLQTQNEGIGNFNDIFRSMDAAVPEAAPGMADDAQAEEPRDYIDTNVQVEGVAEADIVKTDGKIIYYAARYQNKVRVIDATNKLVDIKDDIELGDFYVDNMFLTEDYLVLIGYTYETYSAPYDRGEFIDYMPGFYMIFSGAVIILDRNTLEEVYQLETDGYFYDYRMIDDVLFLVSRKNLYDEEVRPMFKESIEGDTVTSYMSYADIYYFDGVPIYSMTVLTSIKLSNQFDLSSQAFLSDVSHMYVSKDAIYTVFNYYKSEGVWSNFDFSYEQKAQIIQYDLDVEKGTIAYVGSTIIEGHVQNQFWMDAYEGYFRVVTHQWSPVLNRLYVLKAANDTDDLEHAALIDEGLGKPNERVMSVRFNNHLAHVVTFEMIDPLYTIDLTDPYNPEFIGDIEMPGFSSYLHPWLLEHQLIGLGFDADENGFTRGLKLSAFDTNLSEPLYEFVLGSGDPNLFQYSYSEAHYNHKALMISPQHGLIGFPVMSYIYNQNNYYYEYRSQYFIFEIDFSQEQVISDPIIISHAISEYYYPVERGVYIEGVIYTVSFQQLISYDLETNEILESITFIN